MNRHFSVIFVALAFTTTAVTAADKPGEWQVLFDGKEPKGLRAFKGEAFPSKGWILDNGALKTVPKEAGGQVTDLVTTEKFKDFELELEWKVAPGGNSGVMYRVNEAEKGPAWLTGPEMQILDDDKHGDGKNPLTSAGALYGLIAPNAQKKLKPVGEFNAAKLVFKNNHVEHWLNGAKIVEYTWGSDEV
ncbi:MAG: DUF1080 domain-containing protein [Limisphaerales bacterium]